MKTTGFLACVLALFFLSPPVVHAAEAGDEAALRAEAEKLMQQGNFNDAYQKFRELVFDAETDPKKVGGDLNHALGCLQRLARVNEIDPFRERAVEVHRENWRLLWAAAQSYMNYPHHGYMIAGEFQRGDHRGGGKVVNALERDRVRALQLYQQALPTATKDPAKDEAGQFFMALAQALLNNRGYSESWRLQYLTELDELPDYEDGWGYYGNRTGGAPVNEDGEVVYHLLPKTWEAAETDGQRWRWALMMAAEVNPRLLNQTRFEFANFLLNQFGVQSMQQYGWFFGRSAPTDDGDKDESGTYALHTLGEDETIAKLATGIKRFKLPDEFNFIKVYEQIVSDDATGYGQQAMDQICQVFENRRQYIRAAEAWRQNIRKYGSQPHKTQRLEQIVGNWGRFEPIMAQPAGSGATIEYRFRNGKQVSFEAHAIKVKPLLDDVKAYLKNAEGQLDWNKVNIGNIGYRLVHENQDQYLGEKAAAWNLDLEPLPDHFDRRITVHTPLQRAGAYLLTATMEDGNVSKVIIWVADTAIVKKPLENKAYYFVADAVTGKPIAKANVEFFGWWQQHLGNNKYKVNVKQFAEFTDKDGQVLQDVGDDANRHQWLITATTDQGRLAYLGFTGVWHSRYYDAEYNQVKTFAITDRPVYRPEDKVQFKLWVRHAQYDKEDVSQFAGQSFSVEIHNPKGEKIYQQQHTADEYGGVEGEYLLPPEATLGVYSYYVVGRGGGNFRVEEYKKPEFEVTIDAPTEPVMLGEKITATIQAKYYFGSPVTEAKVKYKVLRTSYTNQWYPYAPWDWLYGKGYWWFAYDYEWYPGWDNWVGCVRPWPWWYGRSPTPPEVVAEQETVIGPDGTLEVPIDTAIAKEIHPDQDHSYQIVAEVTDRSRRTIVGQGEVLVARKPFKVFAWVDRGYYRAGDVIHAQFKAQRLDSKPVQGEGELTVYRIKYNEKGEPEEQPVRTWVLDTDAQGRADLQMRASIPGQFRLSYKVTDKNDHPIEGGYIFTICGEEFDGAEFRFNAVELIPEKQSYEPGEKVKLQVNTNRLDGTVLLFVRPANGVYLSPQVVRLDGKSTVVELDVTKKDMPNFFVEAVTVAGAKVYNETREIHVPPEKRVLDVEVVSTSETYRPGERAKVTVKLSDTDGRPFIGSTVLAIYDKSVEYISGGSNVQDIKKFFWEWRRSHNVNTQSSLDRWEGNITLKNKPGMSNLGVFGETVADEMGKIMAKRADGLRNEQAKGQRLARASAMPMAPGAAAPMEGAAMAMDAAEADGGGGAGFLGAAGGEAKNEAGGAAAAQLVEPTVRSNFADTALWRANLTTNSDGLVEVELDMPENLTTWKIKAWAMGHGTKVGEGETEVVTRKNLIVRMQAPRFFVEKDEVVLSANVHNYLDSKKSVEVALELDGEELVPLGALTYDVEVPENGEARVDWRVRVAKEGKAVIRMKALTDEESDAMEMTFPVYVHGMLKMEAWSGAIRPEDSADKFVMRVPEERRINESRIEVRYSPTLAGAMVDALPYLIDYPYGCTEQTLNRFLPAVITQNVLLELGLDLKAIQEKRTNLNAQEIGEDKERAKQWKRFDRNPVFDKEELTKIVKEGVQRLTEMQLSDGGWGWFSGWGERSYPHTTAVVVHGLQIAQQNDVALTPGIIDRGLAWLNRYQTGEVAKLQNYVDGKVVNEAQPYKTHADNLDALVYMVLVDADMKNDAMKDFLYRDRTKISVYAMAMYGLALEKQGEEEKLAMIMKNISQYLVEDDENQTAYLKLPEGFWWYWYGSEYEAHAYYLKLLSKTEPKGRVASRMVKYLLNNRKHATYWNSTRDTALVVEAMADYLRASGEMKPDMTVEVWLNGEKKQEVSIKPEDLFTFDNKFVVVGDAVESGEHTIELKKRGDGPLYWNAYLTNFTLEDYITKAGLEIKVERNFYKLNPVDKEIKVAGSRGQAVDQKVEKYEREALSDLATLESGDLVEIELVIDSKNDYEYILFEDLKAAGFEPVEVRSGYNGNELGAYVEFRDNRVTFFVQRLARGKHSVSYRLRAEIPGRFSALPAKAAAMYAPELKANSDEIKLNIVDEKREIQ